MEGCSQHLSFQAFARRNRTTISFYIFLIWMMSFWPLCWLQFEVCFIGNEFKCTFV